MQATILQVTDLYVTAFFLFLFINVFSMLKSLRFLYYEEFFSCITNIVPGGEQVLGNVTESVQESFQQQAAPHNRTLFTECLEYYRSGLGPSHLVSSSCNSRQQAHWMSSQRTNLGNSCAS